MYDLQSQLKKQTLGCKKCTIAFVDSSEKNPSPAPVFIYSRMRFLQRSATTEALLNAYQRYGPIPRICFSVTGSEKRM